MKSVFLASLLLLVSWATAADTDTYHATACEGIYPRHLQGICTNDRDAIYWCWTDYLVKTDREGRVQKKVTVANHHGDLCYHDGRVYVATNLGKFNQPAGQADSWVYVYDAESLVELARHRVPELVHGAGGMAWRGGHFFIVGGLPADVHENSVYEYDENFRFVKRHVIASGYTLLGIQTIAYADGAWWFGCYGKPAVLLRADDQFRFTGKWEFNASVGIAAIKGGDFLIARNTAVKGKNSTITGHRAEVTLAKPDAKTGLTLHTP